MNSLENDPAALKVIKRAIPVIVEFAKVAGAVNSIEGNVRYHAGDAILTGIENEQWTIQRDKFELGYQVVSATLSGETGFYVKKRCIVLAKQLNESISVFVGAQQDPIYGVAGDWLLQYGIGDVGIIQDEIFKKTYDVINKY